MHHRPPGTWNPALSPEMIALQPTISALRRSPDGQAFAFARESNGRTDLFVQASNGWPRQITASHALAGGSYDWSPYGESFVFTSASDGKLWLAPSSGGTPARLTFREGRHHSPRFSPNGRLVAFLCDRIDEIDVVVVSVDGSMQRIFSRNAEFPMAPAWSPDSRKLVWHAYPDHMMPWDQSALIVGDVDAGTSAVIASGDRVAYANASFSPDGNAIVCVCDQNGALNVTLLDADGSNLQSLHVDAWEHGDPMFSPKGEQIAYIRNVDGDYTLWVVSRRGGTPQQITSDPGRAGNPNWSIDGTSLLFTHESPIAPPDIWQIEVESGKKEQLTFAAIGGIASSDLRLPEHVAWKSPDGFDVHGLLYTPAEIVPGRHPCLVEIHGGPMNQSRPVWNGTLQYFLQRGWVVIQPNYRGTLGYGRAYREALFGSWGKGDLEDNLGAIDVARERNLIRPDHVVAWGGSAGAYSVLIGMTQAPERFAAGVALFGLYDLYAFGLETHRYERYYVETILGPSIDNDALWHERSPLNFVDRMIAPILLLHGEKDPAALPAQSETLIDELRRHHIDYEYAYYPGEGHGFRKVETNVDYVRRMDRFLQQKVLRVPEPGPLGVLPYPPRTGATSSA